MLARIDDPNLAVYAVWEPILRTDNERAARKATALFPDARVKQYWVDVRDLGRLFQSPIGLQHEVAWDVYLVYPPGVMWESADPPRPDYFMHQLVGRLPDSQVLDGRTLATRVLEALSK